jgi:voltage-gated potassium channel
MKLAIGVWLGMGGVPAEDNARARVWEHRLHWVMVGVSLLSVPAFFLDTLSHDAWLRRTGWGLDAFVCFVFTAELALMLAVTSNRWVYFWRNWLDLVIVVSAAASLFGASVEWIALARFLRLTLVGLLLLRALSALKNLFSPRGIPFLLGFAVMSLGIAGMGFYWLEPTINSFWDGLWLAFTTGTTVGYGDFVPTTPAARLFAVFIVILGFTMMSLLTAGIVAFFIGQDEDELRHEMHRDIRALRREVQVLLSDEERAIRRDMHRDLRALRQEMFALRRDLKALRGEAGQDATRDDGPRDNFSEP